MAKGARYFKTDFQVHTPRDIQWNGDDSVTDEERKQYARELIQACREKGLDAIAITDHHDFAFFPYIKKAAQEEVDNEGNTIAPNKQIIVFPGLELTLASPTCQAILILDSDFSIESFPNVLATLAISPNPTSDAKTAKTVRIPNSVVANLSDLYQKLNDHPEIKGKFIVLPNVSNEGKFSLLRLGFDDYYRNMPCVGGYLDGSVTKLKPGNKSKLDGKDKAYGHKAIALFQTSDNRRRDHKDLGTHTTWVKWSEPTAEALRQACLAKESRISQEEPILPSTWIASLEITSSKFLGSMFVDFSQQYTAFIGGTGTGKSTVLEYLRWALCDQPAREESPLSSIQERRKNLIEETLKKFNGETIVTFYINGIRHIAKRNSSAADIHLKIGDSQFEVVTPDEIRNLLPIQAYSQKQLGTVAMKVEELKRFVEQPVKKKLNKIQADLRDVSTKIKVEYNNLMRRKQLEATLGGYETELKSLSEQAIELRKSLKGLTKEDQGTIQQKQLYDNELAAVSSYESDLLKIKTSLEALQNEFTQVSIEEEDLQFQNKELLEGIRSAFSKKTDTIKASISEVLSQFDQAPMKELNDKLSVWKDNHKDFAKKYELAKSKAKVNQEQLTQIERIENRITEVKKLQTETRAILSSIGDPERAYKTAREQWEALLNERVKILDEQCSNFSELSNGLIKAQIQKSLNVELLMHALDVAFARMNIQDQKIERVCLCVRDAEDPVKMWRDIVDELELLASHKAESGEQLPVAPLIQSCGFMQGEISRIATAFDSSKWIDLLTTSLEFNPVFMYRSNKETEEYIDFASASGGQQATALLTVLLNQEGAPLVVDQPEDDINSALQKDVIKQIWEAKKRRQLIFVSHIANFVVNGDAELVHCFDNIQSGDQTSGKLKLSGTIDNKEVREEIAAVMEGGREAIRLRMDKYGY